MDKEISDRFIKELKETFHLYDRNKDGKIDADELDLVFNSLGYEYSKSDLEQMLTYMDFNKTEGVEFEEFLVIMKS